MNLRAKITVAVGALLLVGCRELPRYFTSDETVARAGDRELRMRDLRSVVPQGLSGEDSAAFMRKYIDRWVVKQLKLKEAEVLFSSSADDIDRMVEEYRQALLIRKLDQHYVDRSVDTVFTDDEMFASIASGSFRYDAMFVAPCSESSVAKFANGIADTLISRAASVCIKENRRLVLLVRETPKSAIMLENELKLARLGVTIVDANPGFYPRPRTVSDIVDIVVGRCLDQVGIEHALYERWKRLRIVPPDVRTASRSRA